jgi:hypothetical protein
MPGTSAKSRRLIVDGRKLQNPPLTEVGRAEFPGELPDLPPSLPSDGPRRRGRPRAQSRLSHVKQNRTPTGDWLDDDALARDVAAIVGSRDERLDEGAEILLRLFDFSRRLLGHKLSQDEREELRALVLRERAPASVITRVLVGWRHGVGERDVRRMMKSLNRPSRRPHVVLIYR